MSFGDRHGALSNKDRTQVLDSLWQALNTARHELVESLADGGDKGSRLTAIAVRVRRDTDVSRRDRVQPDRRVKRVVGGALPLFCAICRHIYTACRIIEKRPELVESLADGGTFGLKHELNFNYKWKKCVSRTYNLLKALPTIQLMNEKTQNFYHQYLLRDNQHANR